MARYGAPLRAALASRAVWSLNLWERTCIALEGNHMSGKAFVENLHVRGFDSHLAGHGSTTARGLCLEDKAIKSYANNALVMSVLTLRVPEHKRFCDMICAVCEDLSAFHSRQNEAFDIHIPMYTYIHTYICI